MSETFDYGPGLTNIALPETPVTVFDTSLQHRLFKHARKGIRFAANMSNHTVWTVCVRIDGVEYVVPPVFVTLGIAAGAVGELPSATLLAFPLRGRFAEAAHHA